MYVLVHVQRSSCVLRYGSRCMYVHMGCDASTYAHQQAQPTITPEPATHRAHTTPTRTCSITTVCTERYMWQCSTHVAIHNTYTRTRVRQQTPRYVYMQTVHTYTCIRQRGRAYGHHQNCSCVCMRTGAVCATASSGMIAAHRWQPLCVPFECKCAV